MAEQDHCMKKLLQNKERFADLFNTELFYGEQVLKGEDLELVPNENGIIYIDKVGKKRTLERRRDVAMQAPLGVCFALFTCEGQADVHYGMPVRTMLYDALSYMEQIEELERIHEENKDVLTGAEFLSHMSKEDRLIPVITLTLYYGKEEWDGAKSLYDLLGINESDQRIQMIKKYLPDYRLNLIDVRHTERLQTFQTSLQYVFSMLKYNSDKKTFYQYVKEHQEEIRGMDGDSMMALFALLGEQKRLMKLIEKDGRTGGVDMCQAIDDLIADGENRGIEQGIERGIEQGIKYGEERLSALLTVLLENGKPEQMQSALRDQALRQKLYQEYGL